MELKAELAVGLLISGRADTVPHMLQSRSIRTSGKTQNNRRQIGVQYTLLLLLCMSVYVSYTALYSIQMTVILVSYRAGCQEEHAHTCMSRLVNADIYVYM